MKLKKALINRLKADADFFCFACKELDVKPITFSQYLNVDHNSLNKLLRYNILVSMAEYLGVRPEDVLDGNIPPKAKKYNFKTGTGLDGIPPLENLSGRPGVLNDVDLKKGDLKDTELKETLDESETVPEKVLTNGSLFQMEEQQRTG